MSGEDYLLSLLHKKPELFHTEPNYINQRPCPFLEYSKDRLTIKYLGKGLLYSDITSVQSIKPANQETLVYYYEVKINHIGDRGDISIGLADADFPLNKHPGWTKKSYGYKADGKVYNNKQAGSKILPKFTTGNYVGCGINYFKREIFYTLNGEYQGAVFKDIELREYFATISLHSQNECITFNFGNKPFKFDVKKLILDEKRENVKSILKQPINHYSLHQIVHSYLNFHGYANTLEVFEKTAQIERRDVGLPRSEVFEESSEDKKIEEEIEDGETTDHKLKKKATTDEEMEIETKKDRRQGNDHNNHDHNHHEENNREIFDKEGRYRSDSLRLEFESPNFTSIRDQFSNEMEPFMLNSDNSNSYSKDFMLLRKASLYVDQNPNTMTTASSNIGNHFVGTQQNSTNHNHNGRSNTYLLHERANLRQLLLAGKIAEATSYIEKLFPTLLEEKREILKTLHAQQFIEYIKVKDHHKAIIYAQKYLTQYQQEKIYCLDDKKVAQEVSIDNMMALLCYPDPENSELKNFLSFEQRDLTADIINRAILSKMGFIDKSILDILIAQLAQTEAAYREHNLHSGEDFKFGV